MILSPKPRLALFSSLMFAVVVTGGGLLVGCANNSDTNQSSSTTPEVELSVDSVETDVPYVPTPQSVVSRMLEMAEVDENDVVYDLGSGDGRFVITAAEEFGARGVGIEIDPQRIEEARQNAKEAGVTDLVEFRQEDLFEADISEATVVTLYLLRSVNLDLRPKLFNELEPGTPVVSHDFDMGEWEPEQTEEMGNDTIYLWRIPEEAPEHLQDQAEDGS